MYRPSVFIRSALSHYKSTSIGRPLRVAPFARAATLRCAAFRPQPRRIAASVRYSSSLTAPESENESAQVKTPPPSYHLVFTCKPCRTRSGHNVTKQAYHHGSVLITCPSCKNRHVISDHLRIFMDEKSSFEDILRRTTNDGDLSKLLRKGVVNPKDGGSIGKEEQDFEFWDDKPIPYKPFGTESNVKPEVDESGNPKYKY